MMSKAPLVTIITPAYNRADLVAETIESVLGQDYPNLEYIVLDDGSSDATLEVVKRYAGRLRWEHHPNMGEARTVNRGFSLASGEIVGVVNSDDPLLPGAVTRMVAAFASHRKLMVAYPDWQMIDGSGNVLDVVPCKEFTGLEDMVRKHYCLPGPGAFFRREVLEKIHGRDPRFRYVGDLEFWLRSGLVGDFAHVPEVLATHRIHAGAATVSAVGKTMSAEHIRLVDKFFDLPDIPEDARRIRREAYGSAYFFAGLACGRWALGRKLFCFSRAVLGAPLKYLGEYKGRLGMMLLVCCGVDRSGAVLFLKRLSRYLGR